MNSVFSIFSGKYFNQNLICLILAYLGVFFADRCDNGECLIYVFRAFLLFAMSSMIVTLILYTYEYCVMKIVKAKCHKLRYEYSKKQCEESKISKLKNIISW